MNDTFYRVRTEEEKASGKFPMWDSIKEHLKDMRQRVDVPEEQTRILSHITLFDKRQFVIDTIKTPIQKALESGEQVEEAIETAVQVFKENISDITKENTVQLNTHFLINLEERYIENWAKPAISRQKWFLFKFEYEHDPYYRYRFCFGVELFALMVRTGQWIIGGDNLECLKLIRDKFFEYEDNHGRHLLFKVVWSRILSTYKKNQEQMEWLAREMFEAVQDGRWQPRPNGEPSFCWKEPGERKTKHWYTL